MKYILLLVAALALPAHAQNAPKKEHHDEFITAGQLLGNIKAAQQGSIREQALASGFAMGYMAGAYDSADLTGLCPPPSVELRQVADIVKKHLIENPDQHWLTGFAVVRIALMKAWRCPTLGELMGLSNAKKPK